MARRIYVGADIKAYGIGKNQIYTSDGAPSDKWPDYAPSNVRDAIVKSPGISHLFMDWDEYMKRRQAGAVAPITSRQSAAPLGPPIKPSPGITRTKIK